ncbi:MAG: hypothetical protein LBK61_07905 [Spirochaetaceae bacterium]|nr:hypothetical protein [Spirochaetaceae bacterium]
MKKLACALFMFAVFTGIVPAQENRAKLTDKGFFIDVGLLYNYENIEPDPIVENSGINMLLGLGYDFGGINIQLFITPWLLTKIKYSGYGYGSNAEIKEGDNNGIGFNIGLKLMNGAIFDITLPVGVLFRRSFLTVQHGDTKEFEYAYLNIESGLVLSFGYKPLTIVIPFYAGYTVQKNSETTNYTKKDFDVMHFNIGLYLRTTF